MANVFLKSQKLVDVGLELLARDVVIPALVWRDAAGDFAGAADSTISIRVPARTTARTRPLGQARPTASEGNGIITMDELVEQKVDVTLTDAVYSAVAITDEQQELDIVNFGRQVLAPQVSAVAEGCENALTAEMVGATYKTTLTLDAADPYKTLVDAHVALNKANVPRDGRVVLAGADIEGAILKSDRLSRVDHSGSDAALRRAEIGNLARFPVYVSNALPADFAVAFHRTAFVLSMRAPKKPEGATYGTSTSKNGLAMRHIKDYDFRNVQDRSLVDVYIGTNIVTDQDGPDADTDRDFVRAVKITAA